jgi:hypothetical protein
VCQGWGFSGGLGPVWNPSEVLWEWSPSPPREGACFEDHAKRAEHDWRSFTSCTAMRTQKLLFG